MIVRAVASEEESVGVLSKRDCIAAQSYFK